MATRYEREMDALHPQTLDQELVLVRKDGTPFGLLKLSLIHISEPTRPY